MQAFFFSFLTENESVSFHRDHLSLKQLLIQPVRLVMKFLQRTRSYVFVCSGSSSVEPVSPNIVSRPSHYLSPLSLLSPAYCTVLPALWLIRGRSLLSLSLLQLPGCSTASSCCLRVFHIDDVSWAQEEKFLRHLSFRLYVKVIYNLSICVILKFGQSQVFLHILCWLNNTL